MVNFSKQLTIIVFVLSFGFCCAPKIQAQVSTEFSGYISNLQSAQFGELEGEWLTQSLLHNRLNFKMYIGDHVTFKAEARNRLMWGNQIAAIPDYINTIGGNNGWVDLSHVWLSGESAVGLSTLDRLSLDFNFEKVNLKVGRQRINWGRTYVWNNNDIFNSYSFFDFDYMEKPGADAARLTYYVGNASQTEVAVKANEQGKITAAAYVLVNKWDYDFQFLAGILNEEEYSIGAGWAGNLWKFGFKGEVNYLQPKEAYSHLLNKALLLSTGLEYSFKNELMLRTEYCYNEAVGELTDLSQVILSQSSVRNLSFSTHSLFIGADYPVTPLLTTSVSGMWMPSVEGYFLGPTVSYSLKENLDFSFVGQYYNMKFGGERSGAVQAFLKLMYSF